MRALSCFFSRRNGQEWTGLLQFLLSSPVPPACIHRPPDPGGDSDAHLMCRTLFPIDCWHTASIICVRKRLCFINRLQREFSSINVYRGNAGLNLFNVLVSAGIKEHPGCWRTEYDFHYSQPVLPVSLPFSMINAQV